MSDEPALQSLRAAFEAEMDPEPTDALLLDRAVTGAMASLAASAAAAAVVASSASAANASHSASAAHAANAANASSQLAAVVARASVTKMVLPFVAGAVFSLAGGALYLGFRDAPAAPAAPPAAAMVKPAPVTPAPVAPESPPVEEARALSIDDLPKLPSSARIELAPSAPALPAAMGETAPELFRAANAARRAGEVDTAITGYRALATRFPGAGESRAARVSLGMLLLDKKSDAPGALREFDAYLAGGSRDTLAEEARLGRALAFQRLGRSDEERRAWHTLIENHPSSLHVPRARARLLALEEPAP